jgi:hypothetical protein
MGADLKNVKRIIHAGPPTSLESKFNVHLNKKHIPSHMFSP